MDKANARVTMAYVAARAGVSATVSHVLNHVPGSGSGPTPGRGAAAAEDLGYVLNGGPRSSGASSEQGTAGANFDPLSIIAVDDSARSRSSAHHKFNSRNRTTQTSHRCLVPAALL